MQDFRRLKVGERAHVLTLDIYRTSRIFPRQELYGLTSQMRRAATSIGSNIAEGACRGGDPDFARFLQMALGSAGELEYQRQLAVDLQLLNSEDYCRLDEQIREVKRMLTALMQRLRAES